MPHQDAWHNEACEDDHRKHLCFLMYGGVRLSHGKEHDELAADDARRLYAPQEA